MNRKICYMGDTALSGAAAYLAGVMNHFGLAYDYVPSDAPPPADFREEPYALYVLSDYPAANLTREDMEHIAARVREGAGLLMIGGWESFHGRNGEYVDTPLAEALPVHLLREDDRRNYAQPCLIHRKMDHEILRDLPFDTPPGIGGFNAFTPRDGADTILTSVQFRVERSGEEYRFEKGAEAPLLVTGTFGSGRTAALATDVAPHWVGGFVDWGDARLTARVGDGFVEVGNWYARFFRNLLVWTSRTEKKVLSAEC